MKLKFLLIFIFVATVAAAQPQLTDCRKEFTLASIAGIRPVAKGESPQGLAIADGVLFALYHGGNCAAIDVETGALLGEFTIDGAEGTHCNNASFGVEVPEGARFPLLYVSECYAPCRCFVEEITTESSRLAATILYTGSGIDSFCDWCIDRENRHLYAYGRTPEKGVVLKRFDLPSPDEADAEGIIRLGDSEVKAEFVYPAGYLGIAQGSHISGGYIWLPTGNPRVGPCHIHLISLDDGRRKAIWDISAFGLEPEGICIYGGRLWQLFAGGKGSIFSFGLADEAAKVGK